MNKNNPGSDEQLRSELLRLGAREFEIVALSMNADRGLAALKQATTKGVNHPVAYAIKLFDSTEWNPTGELRRVATNTYADVKCHACGGDRFVPVTDDPSKLYGETYAPCAGCNADADTAFYRADGTRVMAVAR